MTTTNDDRQTRYRRYACASGVPGCQDEDDRIPTYLTHATHPLAHTHCPSPGVTHRAVGKEDPPKAKRERDSSSQSAIARVVGQRTERVAWLASVQRERAHLTVPDGIKKRMPRAQCAR